MLYIRGGVGPIRYSRRLRPPRRQSGCGMVIMFIAFIALCAGCGGLINLVMK